MRLTLYRITKQAIPTSREEYSGHLISNKTFIQIPDANGPIARASVNIDAGEAVPLDALQVGVEVHPIATQRREAFAMPEKPRKPFKLMRRVETIQQAIFNVGRTPLRETIASSDVSAFDARRYAESAEAIRGVSASGIRRETLEVRK